MKEAMTTMAVRVPVDLQKTMKKDAEKRCLSISSYHRDLLYRGVQNDYEREMLERIQALMDLLLEVQTRQLRNEQNLRTLALALLVDGGKADVESAKNFIDNLP